MKKLLCAMVVVCVCGNASAMLLEDFESYNVGTLVGQGWTMQAPASQEAEIVIGGDGTKMIDSLYKSGFYGFSGTRTAGFTSPITQTVGVAGQAHMAATVTVKPFSGVCYLNMIGWNYVAGTANYGGNHIGTGAGTGGNATFVVNNGYSGGRFFSTDVALANHTYELALNYDFIGYATVTGTLYYKDVTPGSVTGWIKSSIQNVNLNNGNIRLNIANRVYAYGTYIGEMDNLYLGAGHWTVPEPATMGILGLGAITLIRKRK